MKALFREELTRLVPIWNVAPVFTFTMSYFILSESFPPSFLAGFLLILAGSILLSLKKGITLKDGFYLMLLSTFLYSVQIIIVKYASSTLDVASILFWTAVGTFFTTILIFGLNKKREVISKELVSMPPKLFIAFVFLGTVAVSLFAYAVWLGNSAIATVLGGFQSIFLLVLGFYMKKELIDEFEPPFAGYHGVDPGSHDQPYWNVNDLVYVEDISKFMDTNPSDFLFYVSSKGMDIILEYGIKNVETRIIKLTDYLVQELEQLGDYEFISPLESEYRSGVINIRLPDNVDIVKKLLNDNIIVSSRYGGIRISPHFYNTEEDIDKLIAKLWLLLN